MKPDSQETSVKSVSRQRSPLQPFVLIPKLLYTRYAPSWRAILAFNALAYYANNQAASCEGVTMKTMAARVGIGWQTFLRGVQELERKGVVKVRHRSKKSAKGGKIPLPNLYELIDMQPGDAEPI